MATTVQAGSRTGSLSALAPGTTAGDIHITDAPMVAALGTGMRDAALKGAVLRDVVLRDMVGRLGAASKGTDRSQATAEVSMAEGSAAAANKLNRRLTQGWQEKSAS